MTQTININLAPKREPYQLRPRSDKKSAIQAKIDGYNLIVTGLPDEDRLECVLEGGDHELYVLHVPKNDQDYKSLRLHIGFDNNLVEADVTRIKQYNINGERTDIYYKITKSLGPLGQQWGLIHLPKRPCVSDKITDRYNGDLITLERLV